MKKKKKLFRKYKSYIFITTTIVAGLVIFIQNIEYLFEKTRKITHTVEQDICIIDYFFSGDTLDIRLINNGDKTISLTEANFLIDSTWQVYESRTASHFRMLVSNHYDINLPDSSNSYVVKHKLFHALKPNGVDRFQMILGNDRHSSNSSVYFILFRVQIKLNDGNDYLQFEPMIHALGLSVDTTDTSYYNWINWFDFMKKSEINLNEEYNNQYNSNRKNAVNISRMPYYKSEKAKILMERILTN